MLVLMVLYLKNSSTSILSYLTTLIKTSLYLYLHRNIVPRQWQTSNIHRPTSGENSFMYLVILRSRWQSYKNEQTHRTSVQWTNPMQRHIQRVVLPAEDQAKWLSMAANIYAIHNPSIPTWCKSPIQIYHSTSPSNTSTIRRKSQPRCKPMERTKSSRKDQP